VDVTKTKAVEGELDTFICRRHEKRLKEGERPAEEMWAEPERRGGDVYYRTLYPLKLSRSDANVHALVARILAGKLAGPSAEELAVGHYGLSACEADIARARAPVVWHVGERDAQELVSLAGEAVLALLDRDWGRVERLVSALLEEPTLEGVALHRALEKEG
jgi:hypothetical protein